MAPLGRRADEQTGLLVMAPRPVAPRAARRPGRRVWARARVSGDPPLPPLPPRLLLAAGASCPARVGCGRALACDGLMASRGSVCPQHRPARERPRGEASAVQPATGPRAASAGPAARPPKLLFQPVAGLDGVAVKPLLMTNARRAGESRATRPEGTPVSLCAWERPPERALQDSGLP